MQSIYSYILETNHVSRVYCVAAVLYLQFVLREMLFCIVTCLILYISTFRSMCAVPNMAVFCSSLILCYPGRFIIIVTMMMMMMSLVTGLFFLVLLLKQQ